MLKQFTEQADAAVELARNEAYGLRHERVGAEDLIIGIVQMENTIPARALAKLGVPLETARRNVGKLQLPVSARPSKDAPFTDSAKKCLEFSLREALQLGHDHVGPEHLLLGIIRHDSDAIISVLGVYPGGVRQALIAEMWEQVDVKQEPATPEEPVARSSAEISVEIEKLMARLRELTTELNEATKRETGVDPKYVR